MNEPFDPKALAAGTRLRHESGGYVVLARRKDDNTGWWNQDGSGLDDRAALHGWEVDGQEPIHAGRFIMRSEVECSCGKTFRSTDLMLAWGAYLKHQHDLVPDDRAIEMA